MTQRGLAAKTFATRPFTNLDVAARKLVEIANDVEAVQEGRILHRARQCSVPRGGRHRRRLPRRYRASRRPRVALAARERDEEVQLCAFDVLAEDFRKLPLHLRKSNLERLLARRPDGIFLSPF
jgi:hypothetical protein